VAVGDTGGELVLYVTSIGKAKKRLNKDPLHWYGFPLVIRKMSRTGPRPLRGGIGNHLRYKDYP
jgi:hypothetical protein